MPLPKLRVRPLEDRVTPAAVTSFVPLGPPVTNAATVDYRVTFDAPVSGLSADAFAPTGTPAAVDLRPHQTFEQVLGPLPSLLSADVLTYPDRLADARTAQVPLARGREYFVSPAGDDRDGDGSAAHPWASVVPVNRMLEGETSFGNNGRTFTAADSTPFHFGDRSWTVGGWVNVGEAYYGAVLASPGAWAVAVSSYPTGGPYASVTAGGLEYTVQWPTSIVGTGWHLVVGSFDHLTRTLAVSVDTGTPQTVTVPAAPTAGTGPLVANGGWVGGYNGQTARLFVAADRVLTAADRATLFNGGRGLRYPIVPTALKPSLTAWWEMDRPAGQLDYTTFPDSRGGPALTTNPGGGNAPALDADDPITASPAGRVAGGADLSVAFQRGGVYRTPVGHTLTGSRDAITLKAYGDPALPPPVLSEFSVVYPAGGWQLDAGTTYRRPSVDVAWVKRAGTELPPFPAPLLLARDPAQVRATPNSFCWAGGFLYLNAGGQPDAASPAGWVAAPWTGGTGGSSASPVLRGDNIRVDGLLFEGGGLSRPGTGSGYGLQLFVDKEFGEVAVTDSQFFFTGYHSLGVIGQTGITTTTRGNRAGYFAARNPEPTTGFRADTGTHFVTYVGNPGNNEVLSVDDEAYGGVLPDWTGAAPGGVGGDAFFAHDGPFRLYLVSRFKVTGTPHGRPLRGVAVGNTDAPALADVRAVVIGTTTNIPGFDLTDAFAGAALVNVVNPTPVPAGGTGYLRSVGGRGDGTVWYINCGTVYVPPSPANSVALYGNLPPTRGVSERWVNGFLGLADIGPRPVRFSDLQATGAPGHTFTGSVLSVDGSGPVTLGALPASAITNGAVYRVPAPGSVVLPSPPALFAPPAAALADAGPGGGPEYDRTGAYRGGRNTVGPTAAGTYPYPPGLSGVSVLGVSEAGGTGSNAVWTVRLASGTGNGSLGVRLLRSLGLSPAVTNLPYTSGAVRIDRTPPAAPAVVVGDGTAQRSRVTRLTVTFAEPVVFQNNNVATAFTLTGPGGAVTLTAPAPAPGQTTFTLTPTTSLDFGSLADGRYTLTPLGSRITDPAGNSLAAPPTRFHRLFGDGNGDATTDGADFLDFVNGFGLAAGDTGFAPGYDGNGDGVVDGADFLELVNRFGVSV